MQFDLAMEPRRLLHAEALRVPTSFALCHANGTGTKNFGQQFFPMDQLETVLGELPSLPNFSSMHTWITQNTLRANTRNRRVSSVILLNAIWVDIDLTHPPKAFIDAGLKPSHGGQGHLTDRDAFNASELLLMDLEYAGLPRPSCVIATGGGLCLKWIFDQPIPSAARARWTSLQRHVVKRVGEIRSGLEGICDWAWPVDSSVSDAARILRLVNSPNPRWGSTCKMLWDRGPDYDFNVLADEILPYSQDEVKAYRARAATFKTWDQNRNKAAAAGLVRCRTASGRDEHDQMLRDEAVRELWTLRFEIGRQHLANIGGPSIGARNSTWWPMATALAWSCGGDQPLLMRNLAALHQDLYQARGWTWNEACSSAANVLSRLRAGTLYRFKRDTWLEKMGISPAEAGRLQQEVAGSLGHNARRGEWHHGAMGFTKLRDLDFPDWMAAVRSRQAQAGRRSAEIRQTTNGPEKRQQARELAARGLSGRQVAAELGVNQSTVARWLRVEDE